MNLSAPFIRRPIATVLLTLAIILAGGLAYVRLPVAPLPAMSFPTIVVSASLAGANPQTMASTVATPLERSLGRIAGISQMTSTSSQGSTRVIIQFDLDKDINEAAREVQAAINSAEPLLPSAMNSAPTYRKINPADAPILILALTSSDISQGRLYDLADDAIAPKISQVQGVGSVNVGGSSSPAVRIELDPRALEQAGIALDEVRSAVANANSNLPTGFVQNARYRWQVATDSQLFDANDYRRLIIRQSDNGAVVHLGDVAQVTNSVEDVYNIGFYNKQPAVLLVVSASAGANVIETIAGVRARLPQIIATLPASASLNVVLDRSPGINASLHETQFTLLLAVALVVMVVFVFLRSPRATLIPSAVVPVSLIGTFGVMYLLGYSLDTLSLMALVVAIGFIVDDAIVVVENIARHIEHGESTFKAALEGAREVGFTVLSMSVSLVAVFIPLLLLGGFIGRLFHEFAVTLSVAILVSLLVSLTLTPMLCSRWLRVRERKKPSRWQHGVERLGHAIARGYEVTLDIALRHRRLTLLSLIAVIVLNGYLYGAINKGFIPEQDTGRLIGSVRGDQSLSFAAMSAKLEHIRDTLLADPQVDSVLGFMGGGGRNGGSSSSATLFVTLKENHRAGTQQVGNRLSAKLSDMPGMQTFMRALQDIHIGGRESNGQYEVTLKSDDLGLLQQWSPKISQAMQAVPAITGVSSDNRSQGQAVKLIVDRDKAARLGIDMNTVDTVLHDAFSQRTVSSVYQGTNQYYVVMEVAKPFRQSAQALDMLHVFDGDGSRVPLSAFSHYERSTTPVSVNHQGQFAATTVSFNLADGVTLGQATQAIRAKLDELHLPIDVQADFEGSAASFQSGVEAMPWLILAALLTVYLVLGILYESYIHPLTILSTLPSAGIGALLALMLLGKPFTLIALIGIILLIGVVKKNAIMLVDFALDAERRLGMAPFEAIRHAALVRFRPIMMTTLAAILGAIPLMIGTDENAALRAPLGISIVGGLIVSQLLTLYTTPVVYLYLDKLRHRFKRSGAS